MYFIDLSETFFFYQMRYGETVFLWISQIEWGIGNHSLNFVRQKNVANKSVHSVRSVKPLSISRLALILQIYPNFFFIK